MPFELKLDDLPAGYAAHDSTEGDGATVELFTREFTSSDDGDLFISRLEGFPSILLNKLGVGIKPSQVDHMLAIIKRDLSCKVYLNELKILANIQVTRSIRAGEPVREDDIADISELKFVDVEVPDDAAVVCLFSVDWRKGLFFDFQPALPDGSPRDYNLAQTLGGFFAFLSNRSVFSLDESQWKVLLEADWFPFISLPKSLLKTLVGRAKGSGNLDIIVPEIATAVRERIPRMLERWAEMSEYEAHYKLLQHATSRFLDGDFISAVAITFPRIEGILRAVYSRLPSTERPNQSRLAGSLLHLGGNELHPYSWLLPERFIQYLKESYFADFEPGLPSRLSRHSIGHGVANLTDFNEKHAATGFLILDQIAFLIRRAR